MKQWSEDLYHIAYSLKIREGTDKGKVVTYGRQYAINVQNPHSQTTLDMWIQRWGFLVDHYPILTTQTVAVIGCGFGFLNEVAHDMGYPTVIGIDTSPFIHDNKLSESRADVVILDLDITSPAILSSLLTAVGINQFNWIITELVIESCESESELQAFLDACENLQTGDGGVIHLLVTRQDENEVSDIGLWLRTLDEWVSSRSSHHWITTNGYHRAGGL